MSNLFPEIAPQLHSTFPELESTLPSQSIPGNVKLYLIRHTSTDIDDADRIHGTLDPPLNEKGIADAKRIAARLDGVNFDHMYASTARRAVETANIISQRNGVPVEPTDQLKSLNMGKFSGMKREEVDKEFPKILKEWESNPDKKVPNGDSFTDFQNRNLGFLRSALTQGTIGIVGHSMTSHYIEKLATKGGLVPLVGKDAKVTTNGHVLPDIEVMRYSNGKLSR